MDRGKAGRQRDGGEKVVMDRRMDWRKRGMMGWTDKRKRGKEGSRKWTDKQREGNKGRGGRK